MLKLKMNNQIIIPIIFILIVISINTVQALIIESVTTDKLEVTHGDITEIEISLKNNGDVDIERISVNLDLANLPFAPFDSSTDFSIDEIREDKIKNARFKLIVLNDAQPTIYKIPIKISYSEEDSSEIITKTSLISLKVVSKPILGINKEKYLLLKGEVNDLSIKIVNKGLSNVRFLELEIQPSNNFQLLTTNKVYIGDLDSDDFDSVTMNLVISENSPNRINVPLVMKYKDPLNKEYIENVSLQFEVYERKKAIELGLIKKSYTKEILILIIILIVFYFLYKYIKRRLKKQ